MNLNSRKSLGLMAFIFTSGNAVSHGFSMFLYSAILPRIKEIYGLSYTQAAFVSSVFLISYMSASVISGIILSKYNSRTVLIWAIGLCPPSILISAYAPNIYVYTFFLALVSACAVTHWNAIVDYVTDNFDKSVRSKILGLSSSGGAFAICLNGLLISLVLPVFGIQWFVSFCSFLTLIVFIMTLLYLPKSNKDKVVSSFDYKNVKSLIIDLLNSKLAVDIFIFSLFIGFFSGPFTNFISSYMLSGIGTLEQSGQTWFLIGLFGAIGGVFVGAMTDRFDIIPSVRFLFIVFSISLIVLLIQPSVWSLYLCACIFGFMYFPIWGLMASYVGRFVDSKKSTTIISLSMVGYGVGNSLISYIWGNILDFMLEYNFSYAYEVIFLWVLFISMVCFFYLSLFNEDRLSDSKGLAV